jgi:hypothetical protein
MTKRILADFDLNDNYRTAQPKKAMKELQATFKPSISQSSVISNSIEVIKGKLYWYCNRYPPKNVPESFFFNIDEVRLIICPLHFY